MNKTICYRLTLTLQSALSIGTTQSEETDCDVIRDGRNLPLIPASSIAGVLRSGLDEKSAKDLFGDIDQSNGDAIESAVRVYDATLVSKGNVSVRDNVRLELEDKVAVPGAKFDRQVVDAGAQFVSYIEIEDEFLNESSFETAVQKLEVLFSRLNAGDLAFGSKTSRGLGRVNLSCQKKVFEASEIDAWLDFHMFNEKDWSESDLITLLDYTASAAIFKIDLRVDGALSIRQNTTEVYDSIETKENPPDFKQLALSETKEPIIPGSTWAGAFRSHMYKLSNDEMFIDDLFGNVKGSSAQKSRISFSESIVHGGEPKLYTRNSIDRFTNGTIEGALFTELTHYDGIASLEITINNPRQSDFAILIASLADLANGFLSVGGLTAVGHGLFVIEKLDLEIFGHKVTSCNEAFGNNGFVRPDLNKIMQEITGFLELGE